MARAAVSLVRGHTKVFVNDVERLPAVLRALDASATSCTGDHLVALASASQMLLDVTSRYLSDRRVKSLRDVAYITRGKLSAPMQKRLVTLHQVYSFLRHTPTSDITRMTAELVSAIEYELSVPVKNTFVHLDASDDDASRLCASAPATPGCVATTCSELDTNSEAERDTQSAGDRAESFYIGDGVDKGTQASAAELSVACTQTTHMVSEGAPASTVTFRQAGVVISRPRRCSTSVQTTSGMPMIRSTCIQGSLSSDDHKSDAAPQTSCTFDQNTAVAIKPKFRWKWARKRARRLPKFRAKPHVRSQSVQTNAMPRPRSCRVNGRATQTEVDSSSTCSPLLTCVRGHQLVCGPSSFDDHHCDLCSCNIDKDAMTGYCAECDFDLCHDCQQDFLASDESPE